ncbi:Flagellar C1a complex subunit C1a-32 like protein [Aduncisulcus paluster]|uniref:Flagellar C1a complex subunit C1a-32 like protein n=1 Tax=Aduncisulcus paluster TaxID=2918883 RepID=A0ABQ5KJN7_9EUKA|nr:Flagellar C1a complex subunit C1a-32 like protein [Aduncisulcus paluster]
MKAQNEELTKCVITILQNSENEEPIRREAVIRFIEMSWDDSIKYSKDDEDLYEVYDEICENAISFCLSSDLKLTQTTAVFSIMLSLLKLLQNPYKSEKDAMDHLQHAIARCSVHRPPFCFLVFSIAESRAVLTFFVENIIAFWRLYRYSLISKPLINLKCVGTAGKQILKATDYLYKREEVATEDEKGNEVKTIEMKYQLAPLDSGRFEAISSGEVGHIDDEEVLQAVEEAAKKAVDEGIKVAGGTVDEDMLRKAISIAVHREFLGLKEKVAKEISGEDSEEDQDAKKTKKKK